MTRHLIPFPAQELSRFFGDEFLGQNDFFPALDVYQDRDNVVAELALPGIDPAKVDITIENDVLTVTGSTESRQEVKREDYYRKEVRTGSFSRSVVLPMAVKGNDAQAAYAKGVLTITMPKEESVKPKKIAVQISDAK
ncbi:MAG: Hsp20/alpha crystallin family protein [Candidatus Moraniibacteriota bacterium]